MTRRRIASLLAAGLLVALLVASALLPVPYVTVSPGRTVDVLGTHDGEPIVRVEGHRTYPDDEGQLRLTTVSITRPEARMSLTEALVGWVQRDVAVVPYEAMYPDRSTDTEEETLSSAQMISSQDTAVASALRQLGYRLPTYLEVTGVSPDGPSDGVLEPRDRILVLDGVRISSEPDLRRAMEDVRPGDEVSGVVRRDGRRQRFTVTTTAGEDPTQGVLSVFIGTGYRFPFEVRVGIGDEIGGPSAGLVFALSIYDVLTPGSLTAGQVVAGTGTIEPGGRVGPIGGIRQKIAGAHDAGARLFLVPPDNCAAAVLAPVDPDELRLVRADTLRSAIRSLEQYAEDPSAELPRCA